MIEHPNFPNILYTQQESGLMNILKPNVQAVIWQRQITQEVENDVKKIFGDGSPRDIFNRYASRNRKATPLSYNPITGLKERKLYGPESFETVVGKALYRDMNHLSRLFREITGGFNAGGRLSIRSPQIERPPHHGDLFKPHVDHGIKFRLHTTYAGKGINYLARPTRYNDRRRLWKIMEAGELSMDEATEGDVVIFKGAPIDVDANNACEGLMHCEPDSYDLNRLSLILSKPYTSNNNSVSSALNLLGLS